MIRLFAGIIVSMMNEGKYSIGLGRDIHPLVPGRRFMLGGVRLEADFGEDGHSDGDVLCHAVLDAVLGAAGIADIGELFPPGDPACKDACSLDLLKLCVYTTLKLSPWRIANIDSVVSCKGPAILPYRDAIRKSLAEALGLQEAQVFVKGKSGNGVGDVGQGRAVEALAVCLLERG
jgi:2-C-methyl-D-erythritol 2,4-cyclodiphosphate synthase